MGTIISGANPILRGCAARIIYAYVVIAASVYLVRCSAKNVKTDLTADEKKEVRRLAAALKGAQ